MLVQGGAVREGGREERAGVGEDRRGERREERAAAGEEEKPEKRHPFRKGSGQA